MKWGGCLRHSLCSTIPGSMWPRYSESAPTRKLRSPMLTLTGLVAPFLALLVLLLVANASVKVLREYERGVIFALGRFSHVGGPGLILLLPVIQQMVRVDLRTVVMEVPSQDLISHDNVSVKVD